MAQAANFNESVKTGEIAENYFIKLMNKWNKEIIDVRDNPEYQKKDIDFIIDGVTYEVKMNYITALKYHPGLFCWIETDILDDLGNKPGWWNLCEADYFYFFNGDGKYIKIKNDQIFKGFVNDLIENGDREINRFDYKPDRRWNRIVTAKCMRLYVKQLVNSNVDLAPISTQG